MGGELMSKVVYQLINGCIQSAIVDDGYNLKANETFSKPVDGIYQPFSFENGEIVGVSAEEWQEKLPETSNSVQELVVDLSKQLATEKINQSQTNANFLKQLALLQAKINGGATNA